MAGIASILNATDLSAPSRHAADRAALLARAHGARLTLAHTLVDTALDDLLRFGDGDDARSVVETDARQHLHALAVRLGQRHDMEVTEHLSIGNPVRELSRVADEIDADLLVTGTRGTGFFRGVLSGSTAERVARRSARPVLLVRQAPHEPYRRILVPVDFSPWSAASIELARRVAPEAELVLMHAVQVPFEGRLRLAGVPDSRIAQYRGISIGEANRRLDELSAAAGLGDRWVGVASPDGADPWMQIARQEQEQDCDLVVIGKHGRHVLEELLLGSTTRMVIAECSADVLVSTRTSA
ncbi:MAG TPA: universal stress protein [Caldimonas sp.]|nr:universal stress protein [Caldimonas sp.]HEX2541382.1 universal stress protein [Caldimonas sp.]